MEPGYTVCGHNSACAGAPSRTGGVFRKDSSSLGNLKPASLKALPKSLSLGKSEWQVVQEVPYLRENAGIALAEGGSDRTASTDRPANITVKRREIHLPFTDRPQCFKSQPGRLHVGAV